MKSAAHIGCSHIMTSYFNTATLPLHYISYVVLYRAFVAFPLIQKTILNMDLPTRLVGLQQLLQLQVLTNKIELMTFIGKTLHQRMLQP